MTPEGSFYSPSVIEPWLSELRHLGQTCPCRLGHCAKHDPISVNMALKAGWRAPTIRRHMLVKFGSGQARCTPPSFFHSRHAIIFLDTHRRSQTQSTIALLGHLTVSFTAVCGMNENDAIKKRTSLKRHSGKGKKSNFAKGPRPSRSRAFFFTHCPTICKLRLL